MEEKNSNVPKIPIDMIQDDPMARFFTRVWDFCYVHKRLLVTAGLALVLTLSAGLGYWGWKVSAERDASARLGIVLQTAELTENGSSPALIQEIRNIRESRPSTLAGRIAHIYEGRMLFDGGDAAAALDAYNLAFSVLGKDRILGRLVVWERAHVHLHLGDKVSALADFKSVSSEKDFFLQESALFHVARLEAELGAMDKSRAAFERMLDQYPDSPYRETRLF
ncbi:tetratricopeptide repeat protein [Desulfobotulus alkaliphilus]|uniref:Tetratricopeptide repeat protein n=1 Tax=Desulfobotulus alkaliphilus TaxID=622671 RepID=A0A562RYH2_9BACT|nr:tetratricopeptide repeat protein [Desulfobotulus alkaliphilus]TWI74125.1 tetratricopeptide repeat protein [Desulfobotulus alkaliphilus]